MTQLTCEQRIDKELESTLETLQKLWSVEMCTVDDEIATEIIEEFGEFNEYGLCFDYVAAGTFRDQEQGYFRYQLSTGGPGDEFRFYCDPSGRCYCIEYWFLDWWDGASRELKGKDKTFMLEIFEWFRECGIVELELEKIREE